MKYSVAFRIWHWLNAFVVLGLLGTVFLRKTFLSWRDNSQLIVSKLDTMGIAITQDQAVILAKAIRAGMWEWHIILGYLLAFSLVLRACLAFFEKQRKARFSSLSLHKKGVQATYYILYISLTFMALSGLTMHFHSDLGLSKEIAHSIKEVHHFVFHFVWIFVVVHIVGVVAAENSGEKGIISRMIHGESRNIQ
jgi:Ni/Fe-hydrogenase 1 B-type cytochrome subunit